VTHHVVYNRKDGSGPISVPRPARPRLRHTAAGRALHALFWIIATPVMLLAALACVCLAAILWIAPYALALLAIWYWRWELGAVAVVLIACGGMIRTDPYPACLRRGFGPRFE